jgi:thymidylate synthase (FAD)
MNFIEPEVVMINEKDPYKKIEIAGRTCYKSEDKITKTSAKKFVKALINRKHTAMLEHQYFVFKIDDSMFAEQYINLLKGYKYLNVTRFVEYMNYNDVVTSNVRYLVSGNVRAICERDVSDPIFKALYFEYPELTYGEQKRSVYDSVTASIVKLSDFNDLTEEEILKHTYFTFRIITDRGVTHELVRHRPCSFAQESTRYVNYKEGLSIALPTGFHEKSEELQKLYQEAFENSERVYGRLIELGEIPQQARAVLPTALKTEIVVTTNLEEWNHIINLRYYGTTGAPHPDIKVVAEKIYNILKKNKMVGGLVA